MRRREARGLAALSLGGGDALDGRIAVALVGGPVDRVDDDERVEAEEADLAALEDARSRAGRRRRWLR